MSKRGIPQSKCWRVKGKRTGKVYGTVHAPTRLFARWAAMEAFGMRALGTPDEGGEWSLSPSSVHHLQCPQYGKGVLHA